MSEQLARDIITSTLEQIDVALQEQPPPPPIVELAPPQAEQVPPSSVEEQQVEEQPHPATNEPPSAVLRVGRPVRLTNRQKDIVRALACMMWVDGHASPVERRIIEQVIDELGPSKEERSEMIMWLEKDCSTLADVQLEHLSDDEKQVLLTHAVVLSLADDVQLPTEKAMLAKIIERTKIPADVVATIMHDAHEDGAVSLPGSALESMPPPAP